MGKNEKKTESEIVQEYANKVIRNTIHHGRVEKRFEGFNDKSVNKKLWTDTDFFLSIVFQSSAQKYAFMDFLVEQFGDEFIEVDKKGQIQIANGLVLAKAMGCELKLEKRSDYPLPNLDLLPFVLDNETSGDE